jgi:BD-FAE protein
MKSIKIKYFLSIPIIIFIIIAVLVILFVPGQEKPPASPQQLESLVSTKTPFDLPGTEARYADNVAYDIYPETVFDLYIPKSADPVPLVIYFHSGRLLDGSRKDVQQGNLSKTVSMLLKNGIALISADYRVIDAAGDELSISRQIEDCGNLIQYIMDSAQFLGINPERVALAGEGIGGGIALWYALQQETESRIPYPFLASASRNGPVSFDPEVWLGMEKMFPGIINPDSYAASLPQENMYGIFNHEESSFELDMLSMITSEAPRVWIQNTIRKYNHPETVADILQHPAQAYTLWLAMTEAGLRDQSVWYLEAENIKDPSCETMADFFIRILVRSFQN